MCTLRRHRGSRSITPCILNISTKMEVSFRSPHPPRRDAPADCWILRWVGPKADFDTSEDCKIWWGTPVDPSLKRQELSRVQYAIDVNKRIKGGENTLKLCKKFWGSISRQGRSQWPRGLRSGSAAVPLLRSRVRILQRAWISVSCECCVLSGRGLCVGLITRPEEFYRVWCVWVWSWSLDNQGALAH
jgi:hypothetical protein